MNIEIDFTEQVVAVSACEGSNLPEALLLTGFDPTKYEESVMHPRPDLGQTIDIPFEAGASVRGTGITSYQTRERTIGGVSGTYEIRGSFRRGQARTFILEITFEKDCITVEVRAGSFPAHWIIGDLEPLRLKEGETITFRTQAENEFEIIPNKPV